MSDFSEDKKKEAVLKLLSLLDEDENKQLSAKEQLAMLKESMARVRDSQEDAGQAWFKRHEKLLESPEGAEEIAKELNMMLRAMVTEAGITPQEIRECMPGGIVPITGDDVLNNLAEFVEKKA
ncbi:MAG: hypothetical protein MRY32_00575 [Rickettsiales bacterium]|nr:hypothetical protein [Rickettsiales bacterium]